MTTNANNSREKDFIDTLFDRVGYNNRINHLYTPKKRNSIDIGLQLSQAMLISELFASLLPAFLEILFDTLLPAGANRSGAAAHDADGF